MAREIPDDCWQRIVEYIGLEKRLIQIKKRDWRFEEARAMVNKGLQGLTLLCYRYVYSAANTTDMVALDVLWATVISYWTNVVKRRAMKRDLIRRTLISQLRVHFNTDKAIDRQRVG